MITVQITHRGNVSVYPVTVNSASFMQGSNWLTVSAPDVSPQTECAIAALTGFDSFRELISYAFVEGCAVDQSDIESGDDVFSFHILIDGKPATYDQVNAVLNPVV